eukprot:CAMPEP_0117862272 /NCGR_PEP_ID=MMETSP0950-20121206/4867_1 /TAXON_ID=44440 /ORGANISM="Chattonella subsalsa, Strain CCMP2191" /LENGTH=319 /DNA_ID=CAMNT_0005712779 /DNA_START=39 /DNA_END=998 /DNA_ORIENTATION=-
MIEKLPSELAKVQDQSVAEKSVEAATNQTCSEKNAASQQCNPAPFSPKHLSLTPKRPSLKRKRQEAQAKGNKPKAVKFGSEPPLVITLEKLGPAEPWGEEMEKSVLKRDSSQEELKLDEMMKKWKTRMEKGKGIDGASTCKHKMEIEAPNLIKDQSVSKEADETKQVIQGGQVNVTAALCRIVPHLMKPKKFVKAAKLLERLLSAEITPANSDEFADALGASLGTGNMLHSDSTWEAYVSLFSCAYDKFNFFTPQRKADVALWACAALVFNVVTKSGFTDENVGTLVEKLETCIKHIDSSQGAPAVAQEILVARLYLTA